MHYGAWNSLQLMQLRAEAAQGASAKAIARTMNRTPRAITAIALVHKIKIGKQRKWKPDEINHLNDLLEKGLQIKEIAAIITTRNRDSISGKIWNTRKQNAHAD